MGTSVAEVWSKPSCLRGIARSRIARVPWIFKQWCALARSRRRTLRGLFFHSGQSLNCRVAAEPLKQGAFSHPVGMIQLQDFLSDFADFVERLYLGICQRETLKPAIITWMEKTNQ